jgi:F-type H+-transporting ATPase subunit a
MRLSPDEFVFWTWGFVNINATLVFTWATMIFLVGGSWYVTRRLIPRAARGRSRGIVELAVVIIREQIRDAARDQPDRYLPFVGTLFLFIAVSTLLSVIPGFRPPAASLSTTAALATLVFVAVPYFGIKSMGVGEYFAGYVRPTPFMLPFQVIGELSRTLALAIRLFGNMMSGRVLVAILISVAPLLFPAVLEAFGLLIGIIQAYVFAILALVYVASGGRTYRSRTHQQEGGEDDRANADARAIESN